MPRDDAHPAIERRVQSRDHMFRAPVYAWEVRERPPRWLTSDTNGQSRGPCNHCRWFTRRTLRTCYYTHSYGLLHRSVSSVAQSCPTLCDSMNCSTPGLPVHHQLPEFTQTHVHWVGDAIQPSHPLSSPPPPAPNPSQHWGLFQWVSSSHQVAKVLEFQLQHQSFQWTPRTDLL